VKWVRGQKYAVTQATPGLHVDWCLERLQKGVIEVKQYQIVLLLVGTNDMDRKTPQETGETMEKIVSFIKQVNPGAKIGIVGVLYRPQDFPDDMKEIEMVYNPPPSSDLDLEHPSSKAYPEVITSLPSTSRCYQSCNLNCQAAATTAVSSQENDPPREKIKTP
jgi:lysophospholipase L1-like esterase